MGSVQYSQVGMESVFHQCTMAGSQWVCHQSGQVVEQSVSHQCTMAGRQWVCCLLYTSPSPRDDNRSRMPSSA